MKKTNSKSVETLIHDEAKRKNIPTAEFQSVLQKEAQNPQLFWRGKDAQDWSDRLVYAN